MALLIWSKPGLLPLPGLDSHAGNNSVPWTIIFTLTLLTLLPALVLSMTPMVRLLVVFHFLRQVLGTQTAPSNQTLIGLGLFLTWFLMQPVLTVSDPAGGRTLSAGPDHRPRSDRKRLRGACGRACCVMLWGRTSSSLNISAALAAGMPGEA